LPFDRFYAIRLEEFDRRKPIMDTRALGRKHLERRLGPLRDRQDLARPPRGWIRAVREALGMTTRQLARRMGKAQSVIVATEQGEARDSVSLATLRQAAEALDCTLVYALVPKRPIDEILRARAEDFAAQRLASASHTMALENQSLSPADQEAERERLIDELLRGSPTRLWDDLS
jgi:predicted DNA-binding mobile mystery protein A